MKHLLHVVAGMDPALGGVSQAVRTMIAGLAAQGVASEVASLDAPGPAWGQADAFALHALGPAMGPWAYAPALGPWLRRHLPRFDAVVLHGLWLYHGYGLRQALRRTRAAGQPLPQLLVMPHGMLDPYFQRAGGRRLKAWRNRAYWQLVEQFVVNEADGLLFTCETERQLAHEPFAPYHPRREAVVGLGVAEPPARTAAMQAAFEACCPGLGNRPYLLFLGRIHEKKGVEMLLHAYARQAQAEPAPPALVLAGPGLDSTYGQQLHQLAAQLPLPTAVYWPGMLSGEAKWGAFYGCEAFVLPSHQENFGIAVVEALACGKPALVADQVNIWREIVEGGGGLAAPDTAAGTGELLACWAAQPPAARQAYGQRARRLYETTFAVDAATRRLLAALAC